MLVFHANNKLWIQPQNNNGICIWNAKQMGLSQSPHTCSQAAGIFLGANKKRPGNFPALSDAWITPSPQRLFLTGGTKFFAAVTARLAFTRPLP
jgi:hypothetical protein